MSHGAVHGYARHTPGSARSGPSQPRKLEGWVPGAGLEREEQLSSSAFVGAVGCAQPSADGFSRCVLPACRKARRPWEQTTARVTGGLGGETEGSF